MVVSSVGCPMSSMLGAVTSQVSTMLWAAISTTSKGAIDKALDTFLLIAMNFTGFSGGSFDMVREIIETFGIPILEYGEAGF